MFTAKNFVDFRPGVSKISRKNQDLKRFGGNSMFVLHTLSFKEFGSLVCL